MLCVEHAVYLKSGIDDYVVHAALLDILPIPALLASIDFKSHL